MSMKCVKKIGCTLCVVNYCIWYENELKIHIKWFSTPWILHGVCGWFLMSGRIKPLLYLWFKYQSHGGSLHRFTVCVPFAMIYSVYIYNYHLLISISAFARCNCGIIGFSTQLTHSLQYILVILHYIILFFYICIYIYHRHVHN